jgi:hypothetical protein
MFRHRSNWQHLFSRIALAVAGVVLFSVNGSAQNVLLQPPSQEIYLGAYINPTGQGESVQGVNQFETGIDRTLALIEHHYRWTGLGQNFPSPLEQDDQNKGRVPVIAWDCGVPNAVVASGAVDSTIIAAAKAIQAYGGPVMLRYMGNMNLPVANNNVACYDPNSDNPDGSFSAQQFIAAWHHIRSIFACPDAPLRCRPVTNVVWLWNPGGGGLPFADYYPGDAEVDWLGVSVFDNDQTEAQDQFYQTVNSVYPALTSVSANKPILLETAAVHGSQVAFLYYGDPVQNLKHNFPNIQGLIYYDAVVSGFDYTLDDFGAPCVFVILAHTHYMTALPMKSEDSGVPPPDCCPCMIPGPN